jgi:hypothetical protein
LTQYVNLERCFSLLVSPHDRWQALPCILTDCLEFLDYFMKIFFMHHPPHVLYMYAAGFMQNSASHLVNSSSKLYSQILGRFLVSLLSPTLQAVTRLVVCFTLHHVGYFIFKYTKLDMWILLRLTQVPPSWLLEGLKPAGINANQ